LIDSQQDPDYLTLVLFRRLTVCYVIIGTKHRDHLFVECPYSAYVRTLCRLKLKLQPWTLRNSIYQRRV